MLHCEPQLAATEEIAIEYLTRIMNDDAVFCPIDSVEEKEHFVGSNDVSYRWLKSFDDGPSPGVTPGSVMFGFHSYGGFQRLMKHNRKKSTHELQRSSTIPVTANMLTAAPLMEHQ